MDIELRHLRAICAIAETGSVTKAATVLGLAQPALTAQLQRIEKALGGPLFERDRRGARPTALGELVLARARVLLPAVQGLQDEAARIAGTTDTINRYRIGAVHGPILGGLVHRLTAEHPDAHLSTFHSFSADELAEMTVTGRLDFAIVGVCGNANQYAGNGMVWQPICLDAVFLLLPERHPLAGAAEVPLAAMADAQWTMVPGDGCFGECFQTACGRAGFTPQHVFENDVESCLHLIEAGVAVGLCQGPFRDMPGLTKVPITDSPLRWRQLLGWRPDGPAAGLAPIVHRHAAAAYLDTVARSPGYARWLAAHPTFGVQPLLT